MPINRTEGEIIGNLGGDFEIMPVEIYAATDEFKQACEHAAAKFKDAGVIETPLRFHVDDVQAQYYPRAKPAPLLVFLFCKKCRGGHDSAEGPKREDMPIERFVTYQFSVIDTPHAPGHA
jgi:hypothetical protein